MVKISYALDLISRIVTNFVFHTIRRKPTSHREEVVHKIVKMLSNSKPEDIKGPFFDPVLYLSPLLSLEYGSLPYSSPIETTKETPSDQVIRSALKLPPAQETLNTQSAPEPPPEDLALAINPPERFDSTYAPGESQNLNNMNSTYTMGTATEHPVSSNACQGSGLTGADISCQSFSHPGPVSFSQSNNTQEAHGSIPRQDLQYNREFGFPPTSREAERCPRTTNASAVGFYDSGRTLDDGSCYPWFPDFNDAPGASAPDLDSTTRPTADAGNCVPCFPDSDNMLGVVDTGSHFPWSPNDTLEGGIPLFPDNTLGVVDTIPWFDITQFRTVNDKPGPEAPGSTAGAGNNVQGFETNT